MQVDLIHDAPVTLLTASPRRYARASAAESLIDQGALVRKARFPREAIPASSVTVQLVTFVAIMVLLAPVAVVLRGSFELSLLLLPVLAVLLFCFVLGWSLIVSVLHAYFRDVAP